MKKDKAWLKNEVKSLFDEAYDSGKMEYHESEESIHRINSLVDQLDEPEVLSLDWIDDNKKYSSVHNIGYYVPLGKLHNLLAPKQDDGFVVFEKDKLDAEVQRMIDETYEAMNEKTVIPQFVADWIEEFYLQGSNPLKVYNELDDDFVNGWTTDEDAEVYHWIRKNSDDFIDSLRNGYCVEVDPCN